MRTFTRTLAVALVLSLGADTTQAQSPLPTDFWSTLGDSTLARLVSETRLANRDVRIAVARASELRAERTGAALDLLPVVTARGGFTRQRYASASFPGAPAAW